MIAWLQYLVDARPVGELDVDGPDVCKEGVQHITFGRWGQRGRSDRVLGLEGDDFYSSFGIGALLGALVGGDRRRDQEDDQCMGED